MMLGIVLVNKTDAVPAFMLLTVWWLECDKEYNKRGAPEWHSQLSVQLCAQRGICLGLYLSEIKSS